MIYLIFPLYIKENKKGKMDQSDIQYIIEQLLDASGSKDWSIVDDTVETLKEFLDSNESSDDE